ncbi:hypothetical protein K2X89_16380 [Myxococcota bacterium]|nr:hypothetical protein [Myxococcota bacterium]
MDPALILARAIPSDRVHSGYLLTGAPAPTTAAALAFLRALVCEEAGGTACERCAACRSSRVSGSVGRGVGGIAGANEGVAAPIALDGDGKRGPTYRHVGDHPALFWVARGDDDTRIKIAQIRDLQSALRLRGFESGRRAALIEGADSMSTSAQNSLLRTLEEPPPRTTIVLVATRASALVATIRSRCVRVRFPAEEETALRGAATPTETAAIVSLLDDLRERSPGQILDAAEAYRGARAEAAESVALLIDVAGAWLRERVVDCVTRGGSPSLRELDAHKSLLQLRRDLVTRNANPQMVAERLLFGLRDVTGKSVA